ncbi:hypothetical protein [Bradyrhizobium sp. CCBAU 53415]|uniref:hypothetical protein n=1 Tax=Bradyrhizobium sp. CCBAU 53415 TaxID=1325119 RepID=UPI0023050A00|nr:hypothetical protein [Bradyrhizobium sp. CCBAU 53415]
MISFADFVAFSFDFVRVRCVSIRSFLVRNWCGDACLTALADIANASKHFVLDRGRRTGLSADHFEIGKGAAFSDGSYFCDGTSFSDIPDVVRVQFRGELIDVLHLCREALAFFRTKVP